MLTDAELRRLKPRAKPYKVTDRDGLYVFVSVKGTITFRYDYRLNGRRESVTIGQYGPSALSLAEARAKCVAAKRALLDGVSPAFEKQREKRRLKAAKTFGQVADRWFEEAPMADSTRAMRRSIYLRDLEGAFGTRLLSEIAPEDLRGLCSTPLSSERWDRRFRVVKGNVFSWRAPSIASRKSSS